MDWEDYKKEVRKDFESAIYGGHMDYDLYEEIWEQIRENEDDVAILLSPSLTSSQLEQIIDDFSDKDDMEAWFKYQVWDGDDGFRDADGITGKMTSSRAEAEENIKGVINDSRFLKRSKIYHYESDDPESVDAIARYCALEDQYWDIKENFIARVRDNLNYQINARRRRHKLGEVLLPD